MSISSYDAWKLDNDEHDEHAELEDLLDLDSRLSEQADRDNDY